MNYAIIPRTRIEHVCHTAAVSDTLVRRIAEENRPFRELQEVVPSRVGRHEREQGGGGGGMKIVDRCGMAFKGARC
jgi:hypothetical protein